MSNTTKIALAATAVAIAGFIIYRRHTASYSDQGAASASHTSAATAASANPYGSQSAPDGYAAYLQSNINNGTISVDEAGKEYAANQVALAGPQGSNAFGGPGLIGAAKQIAAGLWPPAPTTTAVVPPASGPSTESRSGRGHF